MGALSLMVRMEECAMSDPRVERDFENDLDNNMQKTDKKKKGGGFTESQKNKTQRGSVDSNKC